MGDRVGRVGHALCRHALTWPKTNLTNSQRPKASCSAPGSKLLKGGIHNDRHKFGVRGVQETSESGSIFGASAGVAAERWGGHLAGEALSQAGDLAMETLEQSGAAPLAKFLDHGVVDTIQGELRCTGGLE